MDSIGEDDEEGSHLSLICLPVPELDDDNTDEMEVPHTRPGSKKRKASEDLDISGSLGSKPGKKRKGKTAMLASAEEFFLQFVYMLDENAGSLFDNIGMNAMANKDKAGVRQLKWEAQRDNWVRGRDT
ncbi:CCAAT/enhancer-binding protein zeta-like isoform X2 [Oncorhynchus masou masou]|uniref:CCAAT/enhancer-binding protein zeta-like isoform X2 n=1 Tax=Oncorhynchus masou masou TaxID=90313 RepID=UPI0031836E2A